MLKIICRLLIILTLASGRCPAATPDRNPDSPDFVRASLLIASPGKAVYQLCGHAMIRMQCPSAGLDYIFSFETEDTGMGMWGQLFSQVHGRLVAVDSSEYLRQFQQEGRGVTALTLNLTPRQKRELWRILDNYVAMPPRIFNIRTKHCMSVLLEAIAESLQPSRIIATESTVIGTADMDVVDAGTPDDAPWRNLAIRMAMGNQCDRTGSLFSQSLPTVLLDGYSDFKIVSETGQQRPLFSGTPDVIIRPTLRTEPRVFTPTAVSLVILLLSITAFGLRNIEKLTTAIRAYRISLMTLITIIGIGLIVLISVPAAIGGFDNWNLILFNPLPALVWLAARRKPCFATIRQYYSIILAAFAVTVPWITLSVTAPVAILAIAVAVTAWPAQARP